MSAECGFHMSMFFISAQKFFVLALKQRGEVITWEITYFQTVCELLNGFDDVFAIENLQNKGLKFVQVFSK